MHDMKNFIILSFFLLSIGVLASCTTEPLRTDKISENCQDEKQAMREYLSCTRGALQARLSAEVKIAAEEIADQSIAACTGEKRSYIMAQSRCARTGRDLGLVDSFQAAKQAADRLEQNARSEIITHLRQ